MADPASFWPCCDHCPSPDWAGHTVPCPQGCDNGKPADGDDDGTLEGHDN